MKKLLFFIAFFLLTGTNSAVVSLAYSDNDECIDMPLGDTEENPEESSKNTFEEDDDEVAIDHRWLSKEQTSNISLHFLYQEVVFQSLELEVVVPPPKA